MDPELYIELFSLSQTKLYRARRNILPDTIMIAP